jgi:hypothetical protein
MFHIIENSNYDCSFDDVSVDTADFHQWDGSYHDLFPNNWRDNHVAGTGPVDCLNCASFGCYEGEFIGYCANCATIYQGERGRGFIDTCTEFICDENQHYTSVFDTYLQTVEFAHFLDERTTDERDSEYDDIEYVSDEDELVGFAGQETVFEAHYEGGYSEF